MEKSTQAHFLSLFQFGPQQQPTPSPLSSSFRYRDPRLPLGPAPRPPTVPMYPDLLRYRDPFSGTDAPRPPSGTELNSPTSSGTEHPDLLSGTELPDLLFGTELGSPTSFGYRAQLPDLLSGTELSTPTFSPVPTSSAPRPPIRSHRGTGPARRIRPLPPPALTDPPTPPEPSCRPRAPLRTRQGPRQGRAHSSHADPRSEPSRRH
jgi:hypothetical protein